MGALLEQGYFIGGGRRDVGALSIAAVRPSACRCVRLLDLSRSPQRVGTALQKKCSSRVDVCFGHVSTWLAFMADSVLSRMSIPARVLLNDEFNWEQGSKHFEAESDVGCSGAHGYRTRHATSGSGKHTLTGVAPARRPMASATSVSMAGSWPKSRAGVAVPSYPAAGTAGGGAMGSVSARAEAAAGAASTAAGSSAAMLAPCIHAPS